MTKRLLSMSTSKRFIALLALTVIAACGGRTSLPHSAAAPAILRGHHVRPQSSILSSIVGVGDSLTAGYHSNGFLGATGVTATVYYNKFSVPQGQENGFWADLWEQASTLPL